MATPRQQQSETRQTADQPPGLQLPGWSSAFNISTPIKQAGGGTPRQTNWRLGAPQRTSQGHCRGHASSLTPIMASARRVQQGSTPAKTPGPVGQRVLMGSKAPDLVATSLSRLPNALSAEYWISKAAQEEGLGDCEAAERTFQQALKRDVRPATDLMRAHQAFQQRQPAQQNAAWSSHVPGLDEGDAAPSPAVPVNMLSPKRVHQTRAAHLRSPLRGPASRTGSVDQENVRPKNQVTSQVSSSIIKSPKHSTKTSRSQQLQLQSQLSHAAALPDAQAASQDSVLCARRSTKRQVSFASTLATDDRLDSSAGSTGEGTAASGLADDWAASMQQQALASARCSFRQSDAGCTPMPRRQPEEQGLAADGEAAPTGMPDCEALADRLLSLPSPEEVTPQTSASSRRHESEDTAQPGDLGLSAAHSGMEGQGEAPQQSPLAAVTPLCFGLRRLDLQCSSSGPDGLQHIGAFSFGAATQASALSGAESTPDMQPSMGTFTGQEGGELRASFETAMLDGLTPMAIHRLSMGTGQLFASGSSLAGYQMSPELLGGSEQQQGFENYTPAAAPASAQRLPASCLRTAPRSAFKSRLQYSDGDEVPASLMKAERVPQSASHPARGRREVMGLKREVEMRPGIELGSIALLSPVRANTRLREELGVSKVITPVRRSARKSLGGALAASMLEEHGYAYAPNEALPPRRAELFDHVDMGSPPADDRPDGLVQQGSHASLSPGSATGIDMSNGQSVPSNPAEAAPWLAASQRQAQRCYSTAAEAPEAEASVADAVPPFSPLHTPAPHAADSSAATGSTASALEPEVLPMPQGARLVSNRSGKLSAKRTRASSASGASSNESPSLSPTEAGIRSGLRRSARLINKTQSRLC